MSMKNLLKRNTLGLAVAALTALALLPTTALASRFYSTAGCFVEQDFGEDYFWNGGIANNSNGLGARDRWIRCPIIDDNSISNTSGATVSSRRSIQSIFVNGNDANGESGVNARAQVCIAQFNGTAVTCASAMDLVHSGNTTFTGAFDVSLNPGNLAVLHGGSVLDYAFLQISIPKRGNLGASSIRGYQTF